MRFDITIPLAMATSVVANRLYVHTSCLVKRCDSSKGKFIADFASDDVNASTVRRGTDVPYMTEFYMDWLNRRAHPKFSGSNNYCLGIGLGVEINCNGGWNCYMAIWKEVRCNWYEVPVSETDLRVITCCYC
ncbi:hypothetical protein SNK03_013502 [Fusarium graminearum]|uniref:Uncharacterized protein n=1 Tax=Gibberella zeae TaxID=5518 RepID=A0A8H3KCS3_GIBZA|nr:hypothetical protein FG05_13940 [Fusarium graminearum]CAF3467620.1 unnamed protein product [Fusarium graminearum]CAF3542869.1 unnamed protein product [Fusarium graminearum]CAG1980072.1 unnamed protein product [Fusarium graminearum]CAG1994415.1 unnamed protein product [Fusarium graminearum]